MILDAINNALKYKGLSENLDKALYFISTTNLKNLDIGKHHINSNDFFYIVDEYKTKPSDEGKLEAHKKYIDIHIVISGSELIGHVLLSNQKISRGYDVDNDYALYEGHCSFVKLVPGSFVIIYPNDLHMPGVDENMVDVKKLVMKVSI